MFTFPVTFWGGGATRTNTASPAEIHTAGTSFSFTSVATGTASGTSLVVVSVFAYSNTNTAHSISTVSIDGTNGVIQQQEYASGTAAVSSLAGIATRATTNSSITITVTFNKTTEACRIIVYRLNDLISATPTATASATTGHAAATGSGITTNMNIPANGVAFEAVDAHNTSYTSVNGGDLDIAFTLNGNEACQALSRQGMAQQTNRVFSASVNPNALITLSAAVWN